MATGASFTGFTTRSNFAVAAVLPAFLSLADTVIVTVPFSLGIFSRVSSPLTSMVALTRSLLVATEVLSA